jgi:hypothetical protein
MNLKRGLGQSQKKPPHPKGAGRFFKSTTAILSASGQTVLSLGTVSPDNVFRLTRERCRGVLRGGRDLDGGGGRGSGNGLGGRRLAHRASEGRRGLFEVQSRNVHLYSPGRANAASMCGVLSVYHTLEVISISKYR